MMRSILQRAARAAVFSLAFSATASLAIAPAGAEPYLWPATTPRANAERLETRVVPPEGFVRLPVPTASFADWLRGLPLRPAGEPVRFFNGAVKPGGSHVAVIDIDVGSRDLQQCADAIMRLRAEWQLATGRDRDIGFDYTGGGRVTFTRWSRGERPSSDGRRWRRAGKPDASYASFRRYMDNVFAFAGTYSLERQLKPVADDDLAIGDVFIRGGFPGHAVLVADVVVQPSTGERRFLLLQSFMPAQSIHVLKNPAAGDSPWYPAKWTGPLVTPEWTFPEGSLKRWP
ncbi:MAG: DUF4846 domain-containing protein [Hyphomicrobiaceae bacterium]